MINKWYIYLIELLTNMSFIAGAGVLLLCIFFFVYFFIHLGFEDAKHFKPSLLKKALIALCVLCTLLIVIPSKETMYLMLISDFVTKENIEAGTEVIKETFDYLIDGINKVVNGDERNE